jgi:hypothetical protein
MPATVKLPDGVPQQRELLSEAWENSDGKHTLVFSAGDNKTSSVQYCIRWDSQQNPIPEFQKSQWLVIEEFPFRWETSQVIFLDNHRHSDLNCLKGNCLVWVDSDTLRLSLVSGERTTKYRRVEAGVVVTETGRIQEEKNRYRKLVLEAPKSTQPHLPVPTKSGAVTVTKGGSEPSGAKLLGKVVAVNDELKQVDRKVMALLPTELWAFTPSELGTILQVERTKEDQSYGDGLIFRREKWTLRLKPAQNGHIFETVTFLAAVPAGTVYYAKGSPKEVSLDVDEVQKYLAKLPRIPLTPK